MRASARAVVAMRLTVVMILPVASYALPLDRPLDPAPGPGPYGEDEQQWPVVEVDRVPVSERGWMVRAHENGRPYPPGLLTTLAPMGYDEAVEVIVQFRDGTDGDDIDLLSRLGLRLVHRYVGVDACHVRGPVGAVWDLVDRGVTWYVEPLEPVVHDMDVTTAVINATRVWAAEVQQRLATTDVHIEGEGVTCVVVDTGIDAGHPDLDYGTKVIFNLRSDTGEGPYYEVENSDLGYGHGTHVAGTVAGNGDASAGARRGVAPAAKLIGLTVDTDNSAGYIGGLDWVWQNSRPGNNPNNIKLLTNSWHSTVEEYDPQKALVVLINAISFENNVISTWSAGNDGRQDPDGNELTTSGQGNVPVGIMCAAHEHDGSGVAEFSSRGKRGDTHTYPDVSAPGVRVWSCSARRTVISAGSYVGGNDNPYYLAISGTSMSTPHVAGLVALLWQAAPSAKVSDKHEDHSGDPGDWFERDDTRIHEIEWIIEATATFLEGEGLAVNGIPSRDDELDGFGVDGEPIDYVQGYGMVNAERAVAVALTLSMLRMDNPGSDVTVADALAAYEASLEEGEREMGTDQLFASWSGEYSRYNDQDGAVLAQQNQTKLLYVPDGVESVDIELRYSPLDLVKMSMGSITYTVDFGFDGSEDVRGSISPNLDGVRKGNIPVGGNGGQVWAVSVWGQGVKVQRPLQDRNYVEVRIEYRTSVVAHLSPGEGAVLVDPPNLHSGYYHAISSPWAVGTPSAAYANGPVILPLVMYNLTRVEMLTDDSGEATADDGGLSCSVWWWLVLVLVVLVGVDLVMFRDRRRLVPVPRRVAALTGRVRTAVGRLTRRRMG